MIKVNAQEVKERFRGLIALLRFFTETGNLSYIDRLANALSSETIKAVLYDAIREAAAARRQSIKIKENDKEVLYYDYENKIKAPFIPKDSELADFLSVIEKDMSIAKIVASLALLWGG